MRLLIQQRPHRPKARLRLPQRKPPNQTKLHPKHRSRTIQKAEKDGSAFTLLADDGNEYTIALSDIRDVETEIEKNIQIAIACMKDASGDPEKAAYIVAFPEQEEWTISTDEGITTSNAMSTFMIQTSDGREIGFIKDNCPSDENALTSDSGDSVIVTYVTSDNANFPLEIRKGK